MRHWILGLALGLVVLVHTGCGEQPLATSPQEGADGYRATLREVLQTLAEEAEDPLFRRHFNSMLQVVEVADHGWPQHDRSLSQLWEVFEDASAADGPRYARTYLDRSRPLIVSWVSPTDGQVSFAWLGLPAAWDPEQEYPLYVGLHGLWDVAADPIEYMTYPFLNPGTSFAFEDGYSVSPWGRGNQWYRGISETDIWECIEVIKALVHVDESRQYLSGHSMGGYGAWHIAISSADTWAALGIHAGALWYDQSEVTSAAAERLRDLPTYFVVGDVDDLLAVNLVAYHLLEEAGNPNLAFVTFPGDHAYQQENVENMYLWMRQFDRGQTN